MSVFGNWTAVVSVSGQPDVHLSAPSRDAVVSMAMEYVPCEQHGVLLEQLASMSKWLWLLPSRTAIGDGVTVVVTKE